jgi:hypothetical protein
MSTINSGLPEVYNLPSLSQIRPNSVTASPLEREGSRLQAIEDVAPENAATDQRPTRRYQVMLLLSGFFMTFHVIGINFIYGVFQVSSAMIYPPGSTNRVLIIIIITVQDFYTSPQSNIKDAQGQDALVSLVGSIATGLTWSGSIFVNPMIARFQNVKLITLSGAFIMSLGLFLASYSTKVSLHSANRQDAICITPLLDLAPLSNPIPSVRHRLFDVLLSHNGPDSSLFRSASWLRDGLRLGWLGHRRSRACTFAPIPP